MNFRETSLVKVFQQTAEWGGEKFQGDIILEKDQLPEVSCFNAVCSRDKLWPDGTVYYCINEEGYSMDHIDSIEEALKMIETSTKCIHLYRAPKGSKENYVDIIKPPANSGYSTHVGMLGGAQPLYLDHRCLFNHGTIIHAFMHILGLHHEHVREDRDQYVNVNWDNITEDQWNFFSKVDDTLINRYDTDSILHWGTNAFSKDKSRNTLTSKKPNTPIGQREKLSEMDIEKIQILYGFLTTEKSKHFKTFNTRDLFKPAKWDHKTPSPSVAKPPPQKT